MVKISIIIPCYNEEKTIVEVINKIRTIKLDHTNEIIVIDDGSTDKSLSLISDFDDVKLIRHKSNLGKGAAIRTGIKSASGDILIIQDADLEYHPTDIPQLLQPILDNTADVVLGSRFQGQIHKMKKSHLFGNKLLSYFTSILFGQKITDVMTGYKVFRKIIFDDMEVKSNDFQVEVELVSKILEKKYCIVEVPITYTYREKGKSKITWKDGFISLLFLLKKKSKKFHIRPSIIMALFYIFYVIGQLSTLNYDPKSFIFIGTQWLNNDPRGNIGYDGQFFYYIAKYLFNTPLHMIDIPSYRFQRILYPLLIRIFSLGQVNLIPWVMIFINIGAIVIGTEVLDRLLRLKGLNPWYSLVYGLFIGQLWSVRRDLSEPLACMFVLLAVYSYARKAPLRSAILFSLALFSKETTILFVAGYIAYFLMHRKFKSGISFAILTLVPFALYQLFLRDLFGKFGIIGVGMYNPTILPFYGIYQNVVKTTHPIQLPELLNMIFLIIIPSILSWGIAIVNLLKKRKVKPEILYLLLNTFYLTFLPTFSYVEIMAYARLAMQLVSAFILFSIMTKNQRLLNFSLLWILPLTTYYTYGG